MRPIETGKSLSVIAGVALDWPIVLPYPAAVAAFVEQLGWGHSQLRSGRLLLQM